MGGVILVIPITLTMALRAPRIEPSTSGYSSPRYSYSTTCGNNVGFKLFWQWEWAMAMVAGLTPRWPMSFSSWQVFITTAILEIRSAACCCTFADLLFSRHRMVPQIWGCTVSFKFQKSKKVSVHTGEVTFK